LNSDSDARKLSSQFVNLTRNKAVGEREENKRREIQKIKEDTFKVINNNNNFIPAINKNSAKLAKLKDMSRTLTEEDKGKYAAELSSFFVADESSLERQFGFVKPNVFMSLYNGAIKKRETSKENLKRAKMEETQKLKTQCTFKPNLN